MNRVFFAIGLFAMLAVAPRATYASDWDTFGKVMAGIEGLRILSGGTIDPIGSLTGVKNSGTTTVVYSSTPSCRTTHSRRVVRHGHANICEKHWVTDYVKVTRYVPPHKEYSKKHHKVVRVAGHYVTEWVPNGGHWEWDCEHH